MDTLSVLIIEKNPIIAYAMALQLRQRGYQVFGIFDDGLDAVFELSDQTFLPDLLIISGQLEGVWTGVQTARISSFLYAIPTILITASRKLEIRNNEKQRPNFSVLYKPFTITQLEKMMEMTLTSKNPY